MYFPKEGWTLTFDGESVPGSVTINTEEKKIKVGDWVEVVNYLKSYDTYPEWLYDKVDFETVKNYVYGCYAPNGLIGKVVAIGTHDKDKSKKMIGFNSGGNVYIIGIEGVKKVTKL